MVGDMLLYAANRATTSAVGSVTRKASWGGVALFLLLVGTVFGIVVLFWLLNTRFDAIVAGSIVAAACFVVAIGCALMPKMLDRIDAQRKQPVDPMTETVSAVKEEVNEAVDYFGPIRVIASAFMLGVGIARTVKR